MKYKKNEILEYIGIYKKCKISILKKKNVIVKCKYFDDLTAEEIIKIFDAVFSLLTKEQERIFKNSYLYKNNKNWWTEYYARSTYFRIKCIASQAFINYISDQDEKL